MIRQLALLAASLPAISVLGVAPAAAAMPGSLWLALCSGGDTHWIAIPLAPGQAPRDDREHAGCAHLSCPRETKLARKARLP